MDINSAIVAGLVAALVSLIGMLVNLSIARKTRQATAAQARFAIALEDVKKSIADLRTYTADVEKLRVQVMWLSMTLPDGALDRKERHAKADAFQQEFQRFFDSWASVKTTIPDARLEYIRFLRHEVKNIAHNILDEIKRLRAEGKFDSQESSDFSRLRTAILQINMSLDGFYSHINNLRNERLNELLLSKES